MTDRAANRHGFDARLQKIAQKRTERVNPHTGAVVKPQVRKAPSMLGILLTLYLVFSMVKLLMVQQMGEAEYEAWRAELSEGSTVGSAASFVMGPGLFTGGLDPVLALTGWGEEG